MAISTTESGFVLPNVIARITSLPRALSRRIQSAFVKVNPAPIFVLGNQKSGTSAIAMLLGDLTGKSVTNDLQKETDRTTYDRVVKGDAAFWGFVLRNKMEFSHDIVKEPVLTLLYSDLAKHFPESRFVFVVRDPRDNIRSILNRLKIPGDLRDMDASAWARLNPAWKLNIDSRWLGLGGGTYIEMMAARWNYFADIYLGNRERVLLVEYEPFMKDKLGVLTSLAKSLALEPVNDVSSRLDVQFQPAGDRNVKWLKFFGAENLRKIEDSCGERMSQFGYRKQSESDQKGHEEQSDE